MRAPKRSIAVIAYPLLIAVFLAASQLISADETAPSKTTSLLMLMRLDETFFLGMSASVKRACEATPGERREECNQLALRLQQGVDHEHFARLLTPFFDHNYSPGEIGALLEFYGSKEGKLITDVTLISAYNVLNPSTPRPAPSIDKAMQESVRARVEAFGQSPLFAKLERLAPQLAQELARQSVPYACDLYRQYGFSCAVLGPNGPVDAQSTAAGWYASGATKSMQGDIDGAIADYTRAIELAPSLTYAYNDRGLAKLQRSDFDGAIADFSRNLELDPRSVYAYANRGRAKERKGDLDGADADYTHVIELNPSSAPTYEARSRLRFKRGNLDGALEDATRAIDLDNKVASAYNIRGVIRGEKGDYLLAIADFSRAIELSPKDALPYFNRGNARQERGEYGAAISDFTLAIDRDPSYVEAYVNRGVTHRLKGDPEAAIADLTNAIARDPRTVRWYVERAYAYALLKQEELAIGDLTKAIELDPANPKLYASRGGGYANLGQAQRAIEDFDNAIRLDRDLMDAYRGRGEARHALKQDARAIQDLEQAVRLAPLNADVHNNLAWLLATGEPPSVRSGQRAIELALESCKLSSNKEPDCSDTLAAAYARAGDFQRAVELQIKALANPTAESDAAMQERLRLYRAGKAWPPD